MYVCMYVMYVCMYVCNVCMYVCNVCMYVCMYVCNVCMFMCVGEGGVGIGETKMGMVGQILVAQVGAEDGDWRKLPGALITIALSSQGELTRSDTMCNTL